MSINIKKEKNSQNRHVVDEFFAGALSGALSITVGHPLDTLKTLQQNNGRNISIRTLTKKVYAVGPRHFFRGLSVPLLSYTVVNSIFFGAYENVLHYIKSETPTAFDMATAGCIAGGIQLLVCVPVEVLKIHLQKGATDINANSSLREGCTRIYRKYGFRGFYRGFLPHAARDMPAGAIYFSSYTIMSEYLCYELHFSPLSASFWSGAISGCFSWLTTIPQDVIKTRMQAGTDKTVIGAIKSLRTIGFSAFFQGSRLALLRAFLVNSIVFSTYDLCIRGIRDNRNK